MDAERVMANQTVLIKDGWITALGPSRQVSVPAGATRIDGTGKFLMPGLTDCHAHIPSWGKDEPWHPRASWGEEEMKAALFLFAANGVTTARVMFGWSETVRLKERAAQGELLGPRLYVASTGIFDTAKFAALKAAGFDFLKVRGPPPAGFDSLVAAARRAGFPVAGHVVPEVALPARIGSIEHLVGYAHAVTGVEFRDPFDPPNTPPYAGAPPYSPDGMAVLAKHPLDEAKLRALAAATREAGVWNCPTQALKETIWGNRDTLQHWPELRYLSEKGRRSQFGGLRATDSSGLATARRGLDGYRRIIKALHEAGAGLLLGTDSPIAHMVPGFSIHRELDAFVRAGLTPYQALLTGTRNAAVFFNTLDSTGTVAVGKRADLVLLSGNPLQDIRHTRQPAGVMLGGRWLDRTTLDSGLAKIEGKFEFKY